MRVLIFHGYLLRGTGSNVYNASLAQALATQGHEVHLICQDRNAAELDWVDAVGAWSGGGGLQVDRVREAAHPGSVTVYRPDIGGLLPVYVADRYEGFEVKTFPDLSDAELDGYLETNVAAVREVVASAGEPDAALANHLIMGPVILARAGLRFAIKVHGSDISYTVRPHPERFVPYAREGTDAAAGILAGSSHTARALFETVPAPGLPERTRLGPPGVDVHRFRPQPEEEALRDLEGLATRLDAERHEAGDAQDSFGRDGPAVAAALRAWGEGDRASCSSASGPSSRGCERSSMPSTAVISTPQARWPPRAAASRGMPMRLSRFFRDSSRTRPTATPRPPATRRGRS